VVQHCPRCGAENATAEPLCRGCGQKLYGLLPAGSARVACGTCSAANPAAAEYCVRCGRALGESPSPLEPAVAATAAVATTSVPRSVQAGRRSSPSALAPPPLPFGAGRARIESAGGAVHLPASTAERTLASGVLGAGESAALDLAFDLPLDDPPLTLRYEELGIDLGGGSLRTFRPPHLTQ
jgi:ribosomal protein L40E